MKDQFFPAKYFILIWITRLNNVMVAEIFPNDCINKLASYMNYAGESMNQGGMWWAYLEQVWSVASTIPIPMAPSPGIHTWCNPLPHGAGWTKWWLLVNRMCPKWWKVTSEVWLCRNCGFHLAGPLLFSCCLALRKAKCRFVSCYEEVHIGTAFEELDAAVNCMDGLGSRFSPDKPSDGATQSAHALISAL